MLADRKKSLGRGLDALFGDAEPSETAPSPVQGDAAPVQNNSSGAQRKLPIAALRPGAFQPRRRFDSGPIDQLADSIIIHGILQPLLVRPHPTESGIYEIIAGERRWRAAQKAKLHEAPVVIQNLNDAAAFEIAIIENIQREDLTPIEEAEAYRRLIDEFHYTQDKLSQNVGKSRSHIANTLRLLTLPPEIAELLQDGKLSAGHARALLTADDAVGLARRIVAENLSVRQIEQVIGQQKQKPASKDKIQTNVKAVSAQMLGKDPDTLSLESEMESLLGLKVEINARANDSGEFLIHYQNLDQLDDILRRLTQASKETI